MTHESELSELDLSLAQLVTRGYMEAAAELEEIMVYDTARQWTIEFFESLPDNETYGFAMGRFLDDLESKGAVKVAAHYRKIYDETEA